MRFQQYLNEKLIVLGKGQKYGQIVFLAGGGGSGKGFAAANFMEKNKFKVRDVDAWKTAFLRLNAVTKRYPELEGLNLANPKDVFFLHSFVKEKRIKDKTLDLLLADLRPDRLPNIMFDVTMKDADDITEVVPILKQLGYDTKNIHLVWVLTDYHVAVMNNKKRDRRVPDDILIKTHAGAARTMFDIITGQLKGIVPRYVDGQINVVLNNRENTIFVTNKETKETLKQKGVQAPGEPVFKRVKTGLKDAEGKFETEKQFVIKDFKYVNIKKEGQKIKSDVEWRQDLWKWIIDNIPATKETQGIFALDMMA